MWWPSRTGNVSLNARGSASRFRRNGSTSPTNPAYAATGGPPRRKTGLRPITAIELVPPGRMRTPSAAHRTPGNPSTAARAWSRIPRLLPPIVITRSQVFSPFLTAVRIRPTESGAWPRSTGTRPPSRIIERRSGRLVSGTVPDRPRLRRLAISSPVARTPTRGRAKVLSRRWPFAINAAMCQGRTVSPFATIKVPGRKSPPRGATSRPRGIDAEGRTAFARRMVCSERTTVSAPGGSGPPVTISTAVSYPTRGSFRGWSPGRDRPMSRREAARVPFRVSAGRSRIAMPSMTAWSCGGRFARARTVAAEMRPSAPSTRTFSVEGSPAPTSRTARARASGTESREAVTFGVPDRGIRNRLEVSAS